MQLDMIAFHVHCPMFVLSMVIYHMSEICNYMQLRNYRSLEKVTDALMSYDMKNALKFEITP